MKPIDSVLKILVQQEATELRLASDRRPQMFKGQTELALTIPAMSTKQIRELLDDLWTSHQAALQQHGQLSLAYSSVELGRFVVTLVQPSDSTLEVRFCRDGDAPRGDSASRDRRAEVRNDKPSSVEVAHTLPPALVDVLKRAVSLGASDVHLSPRGAPIVRINGALQPFEGDVGFDATALLGGPEQLEHVRAGRSVDRAFDVPAVGRVRMNVYATEDGLCAAVRILRREAPALADLNLPPLLESLIDLPHGLIVACGPTGCGKSTTLAALVQHALRARARVLVTLEDPIEYVIRPMRASGLVRQREVGTHVRDFATGLRDALREDPDVLLIGEMRDPETISLALTAAETGHLVFASLHSRTAPSAVERIVDTYAPERQRQIRVQLADSLRAVISQRLVPTADGAGRVPAVELLRVTHAVANLIREGRTAQIVNALQSGGDDGMVVLERSLTDLVRANRIRRETALAVANDPAALSEYLRTAGC
ncbi:MAG TPA: PilT/PilU family type 4a pilus ATPase [Candidatus Kryptonia bacterium]|nr:PilT/PilU family type 4a pilus ATPase [Candidatus Kryptonia bacterium]